MLQCTIDLTNFLKCADTLHHEKVGMDNLFYCVHYSDIVELFLLHPSL